MDTAFKRRWDFEYIGINENTYEIKDIMVVLGKDEDKCCVKWDELRRGINTILSKECKINEDKLFGPFFLSKDVIEVGEDTNLVKDNEKFIKAFESKVLMYLYEDAAKQHKSVIFEGCEDYSTYSSVCEEFRVKGYAIFGQRLNINTYALSEEE